MDTRREFVYYTHPSQFQDKQHRKQVKSYVAARANWSERSIHVDPKPRIIRPVPTNEEADNHGEAGKDYGSMRLFTWRSALRLAAPRRMSPPDNKKKRASGPPSADHGAPDDHLCTFHARNFQRAQNNPGASISHEDTLESSAQYSANEGEVELRCPSCRTAQLLLRRPPAAAINALPQVLRQSQGFPAANEFYLEAVDPHYPPICQIFDVVNCFGNNYHTQMQQDEDALHAGVAALQVMKGMFVLASAPSKLPEDVLRLVHVAISRLRERIARNDCCNDEVTIMTVMFLTHLALWWCQLHGGGIFDDVECHVAASIQYPTLPFTPEIRSTVMQIPLGFQKLARLGKLSTQMLALLGRISHYEKLNKKNKTLFTERLLSESSNKRRTYSNFNEACPALSIPAPSIEKHLSHAVLLYCNLTYSPKRSVLEACNLVFSIPRFILVRELPLFVATSPEERQCVLWIWLVLISSLLIANTKRSTLGTELWLQLLARYPACWRWECVEGIMSAFFASEVVVGSLRSHWHVLQRDDPRN